MKVIEEISSGKLAEINHGPKEVQFAFINPDTGKTITPFCKCKDYFNDMFWSNKVKKSVSVYGFSWTPDRDKGVLHKDRLCLAIRLIDRDDKSKFHKIEEENIKGIVDIIAQFSEANGFEPATVEREESDGKHIILYFDKKWTEIPYLNSAFFLLVRLGFTYKHGEDVTKDYKTTAKFISPNDEGYLRLVKNKIEDLLKGKIDSKQTYEKYTNDTIHNYSGIVGYKEYSIK